MQAINKNKPFIQSLQQSCIPKQQQQLQQQQQTKQQQQPKDQKQPKVKQQKARVKLLDFPNGVKAYKLSINDVPQKLILNNWNLVTYDHIDQLLQEIDHPFGKLKQSNNFFTNNTQTVFVSINRSLIDPNLQYEFEESKDETENTREELQKISQSSQYDASNLESMQEILARQKQILKQIGQEKQKFQLAKQKSITPSLSQIVENRMFALVLCHGGYFALGIFDSSGKCLLHKSDHKYVVRGKQGGRQLTKDGNAGSNIKSVGSQIRRDQEKKHQSKINNILTECYESLEKCQVILLQAPGVNHQILIKDEEPLFKLRGKLRSICITAKKANYTEVERIHKEITNVNIFIRNETNIF